MEAAFLLKICSNCAYLLTPKCECELGKDIKKGLDGKCMDFSLANPSEREFRLARFVELVRYGKLKWSDGECQK